MDSVGFSNPVTYPPHSFYTITNYGNTFILHFLITGGMILDSQQGKDINMVFESCALKCSEFRVRPGFGKKNLSVKISQPIIYWALTTENRLIVYSFRYADYSDDLALLKRCFVNEPVIWK